MSVFRILLLFISISAFSAGAAEVSNKAYWLCKNRTQVRTLRVEIDAQNICHAYYSKEGNEKSVGTGRNHESCMNFLNNIKTNLEKSGWTCRDISDTKISS